MKTTTNLIAVMSIFSCIITIAVANADSNGGAVSVLETTANQQVAAHDNVAQDVVAPPKPDEPIPAAQEPVPAEPPAVLDPAEAQVSPDQDANQKTTQAEPAVAPVPVETSAHTSSGFMESVVIDESIISTPMLSAPIYSDPIASSFGIVPNACCSVPCNCCPPTPTVFCLVDPCGCSHEACISVPACCAGQEPNVTWRGGVLGRQIAKVCWSCCDHEVKVIISRRGKVRVRG